MADFSSWAWAREVPGVPRAREMCRPYRSHCTCCSDVLCELAGSHAACAATGAPDNKKGDAAAADNNKVLAADDELPTAL